MEAAWQAFDDWITPMINGFIGKVGDTVGEGVAKAATLAEKPMAMVSERIRPAQAMSQKQDFSPVQERSIEMGRSPYAFNEGVKQDVADALKNMNLSEVTFSAKDVSIDNICAERSTARTQMQSPAQVMQITR